MAMRPEHRLLLYLGRVCLQERLKLLEMTPLHPKLEERIRYSQQSNLLMTLWDSYKMLYMRLNGGAWPRFQLRFY
jgi:hypothetical protein